MKKLTGPLGSFAAMCTVLCPAAAALAADEAAAVSAHSGMIALAVALGIGIAALGAAFGQSRAAAAALEGIARNPNASDKVFVPMILALSFIESLVLFAWVLMFILLNKM